MFKSYEYSPSIFDIPSDPWDIDDEMDRVKTEALSSLTALERAAVLDQKEAFRKEFYYEQHRP